MKKERINDRRSLARVMCAQDWCYDFQSAEANTNLLRLRLIIDQRLARNIVQVADAILVHDGHLEVGQIHD